jgi:hypothetical protein
MEYLLMSTNHSVRILFPLLALLTALPAVANNIAVSTPVLTNQNTADHCVMVQFNLSWEHSWRDEFNWDAAWVFVKYQVAGTTEWKHAYLNPTTDYHIMTCAYSVGLTDNKGMGVFIYRSSTGSGNNSLSMIRLRWDYGANGLPANSTVTVKVFAIEMVYVPQGAFYVGDADADRTGCFYKYGTNKPCQITSEGVINIQQSNGSLWAKSNYDQQSIAPSALPAAFPKGYNAFYCMKYEISEGQWVDFFNTLTTTQKSARDITSSTLNGKNSDGVVQRNTIAWTTGDASSARTNRACSYLDWKDGASYADWAGLRPMTELEYEKACRGTQPVADDEYAWGTSRITPAAAISGTENGAEAVTTMDANCCCDGKVFTGGDGGKGPLRCGIFAKASTTREQAGASYYGIMELTGNLTEWAICLANPSASRNFTGINGDGSLAGNGDANVSIWQYSETGAGLRGGNWLSNTSQMQVAYRGSAGLFSSGRLNTSGFRCVRTAP